MSKIKLSLIIYACCLNKTTKTINKLTNEQPSSHFFLTDPLPEKKRRKKEGEKKRGEKASRREGIGKG